MLSKEQVAEYQEQGYLKVEQLFAPEEAEELAALGNAMRRILLSSLQGAAVTSIQIEGVLHEFSSSPGVREDITDIVLNIKSMALRMHSEGPKRMTLTATGPGRRLTGPFSLCGEGSWRKYPRHSSSRSANVRYIG